MIDLISIANSGNSAIVLFNLLVALYPLILLLTIFVLLAVLSMFLITKHRKKEISFWKFIGYTTLAMMVGLVISYFVLLKQF